MEKKYYLSYYISYQKEITYNNLNKGDMSKEIIQRYSIGEFYCFPRVKNE